MLLEKRKKIKASSFVDPPLVWIGRGCPRTVGWSKLEHLAKVNAGAVALVVGAPAEPAVKKTVFFKKKVRFGEMGIFEAFHFKACRQMARP